MVVKVTHPFETLNHKEEMILNVNARVKTPPSYFYGLKTEAEVAHHLRYTDFEYDPAKTAIAVWFGVPYNEVESLPGYVSGAMDGAWGAINGIPIIASARFMQSIKSEENADIAKDSDSQEKLWQEARRPKLDNIIKYVSDGKNLLASPETFREGLWIVKAGSRKDPCIHIFEDGYEITADGIPTYGKGLRKVSWAWTTMDNDVDGEQLLAWQQERRNKRR